MHVIHIINAFAAGGAEVLVRSMALRLSDLGHQVEVVALSPARGGAKEKSFEAHFRKILESEGVRTHVVSEENASVLKRSLRLSKLIKKIAPDVVHIHLARALLLLLPFFWRQAIIVYTHHNIRFNFPLWLFFAFNRIVSQYIAISSNCKKALEEAGASPIRLVPNGAILPCGMRRELGPGPYRLISVGGLTRQKSFDTLLEAMSILNSDPRLEPRFLLDIVGDGPERTRLEELRDTTGLGESVRFLGTRNNIPELLSKADVYVNSSSFEGLSISLLEAGGAGLPIVATAVGGTPEIVSPKVNGELVPPGNPEALSKSIEAIVADPSTYNKMSGGALSSVAPFSIEGCANSHLELYRELLLRSNESKGV